VTTHAPTTAKSDASKSCDGVLLHVPRAGRDAPPPLVDPRNDSGPDGRPRRGRRSISRMIRAMPPTDDHARSPATRTRGSVARLLLHWLIVAAALGYFAHQVPQLVLSASAGAGEFADLRWGWAAAAVASNLAAVAVYAELHRGLLRVGGARVPVSTAQSITFAENAISNTVPVVGGAGAVAYAISRFHRRGVDAALASWAVLLSGALSTICLIALAAITLGAVGRLSAFAAGAAALAVCTAGFGAWILVTHPALLRVLLRPILSLGRFVPGQCATCRNRRAADIDRFTDRVSGRLARLRPSPLQWSYLVALAVLAWALDFPRHRAASRRRGRLHPARPAGRAGCARRRGRAGSGLRRRRGCRSGWCRARRH
jgi:uncharacterized membrane protein YbhN (UPF0104 family)